jgi:polar amino acid transport system substrate-binding protein
MNLVTLIKIIVIGVTWSFLAAFAQAEPIVFQSTDTPPYWSAQLSGNGLGGEILKLLSSEAGVEYVIDYLPVKRFRQSQASYIVGDPDVLLDQKRRAIFPIAVFRLAFFYYKPHHDVIEYHSLRDLKGHTLGVLRGTIENKEVFVRNRIKVEESDSVESLLRKLRRGRIDFCILVAGTGNYAVQQQFPQERDNFVQSIIPGMDRPIALLIDTEVAEGKKVAQRYRQVLDKTLHSQKYRDILENFYGKNAIQTGRDEQLDKFIQYYSSTWNQ